MLDKQQKSILFKENYYTNGGRKVSNSSKENKQEKDIKEEEVVIKRKIKYHVSQKPSRKIKS